MGILLQEELKKAQDLIKDIVKSHKKDKRRLRKSILRLERELLDSKENELKQKREETIIRKHLQLAQIEAEKNRLKARAEESQKKTYKTTLTNTVRELLELQSRTQSKERVSEELA